MSDPIPHHPSCKWRGFLGFWGFGVLGVCVWSCRNSLRAKPSRRVLARDCRGGASISTLGGRGIAVRMDRRTQRQAMARRGATVWALTYFRRIWPSNIENSIEFVSFSQRSPWRILQYLCDRALVYWIIDIFIEFYYFCFVCLCLPVLFRFGDGCCIVPFVPRCLFEVSNVFFLSWTYLIL